MAVCVDRTTRLLKAVEMFHEMVSPNNNSTTLYHGIDDILHDKIPMFMNDNASHKQLALLEEWGFEK